jgi:SM-20-related protein
LDAVLCPRPFFSENLTASLIADLETRGWAHAPGALDPELVAALRQEAEALEAAGETHLGRVGRAQNETKALSIRKTHIAWLDGASAAQKRFMEGADALRIAMNRRLFLGLFEFEAHFAVYPPGGFYARHMDAFTLPTASAGAFAGPRAERSRVVSLVAYLNADWASANGGQLAVWESAPLDAYGRPDMSQLDDVPPAAELEPEGGGLVLMLSEVIPHEVRQSLATRYAIPGWFRVNTSVGGALDPLR